MEPFIWDQSIIFGDKIWCWSQVLLCIYHFSFNSRVERHVSSCWML